MMSLCQKVILCVITVNVQSRFPYIISEEYTEFEENYLQKGVFEVDISCVRNQHFSDLSDSLNLLDSLNFCSIYGKLK